MYIYMHAKGIVGKRRSKEEEEGGSLSLGAVLTVGRVTARALFSRSRTLEAAHLAHTLTHIYGAMPCLGVTILLLAITALMYSLYSLSHISTHALARMQKRERLWP